MTDLERRELMQKVITNPNAFADLLLSLMERVERLEVPSAFTLHVHEEMSRELQNLLVHDSVANKRRE